MYSYEKRKKAVDLFKQYDESFSAVKRELGCPSHTLLTEWILEDVPEENHNCRKSSSLVKCTQQQKEQGILHMCSSPEPVQQMADELGVSWAAMYDWKQGVLRKRDEHSMAKKRIPTENASKETEELVSDGYRRIKSYRIQKELGVNCGIKVQENIRTPMLHFWVAKYNH